MVGDVVQFSCEQGYSLQVKYNPQYIIWHRFIAQEAQMHIGVQPFQIHRTHTCTTTCSYLMQSCCQKCAICVIIKGCSASLMWRYPLFFYPLAAQTKNYLNCESEGNPNLRWFPSSC